MARSIMFQGTGSDVGKTMLVAAFCRAAYHRGIKVLPFKPQNMSNNAAIVEGGEISRAQWLQAYAAKSTPSLFMNPILLKAQKNGKTQVIVNGKFFALANAQEYTKLKRELLPHVLEAYENLKSQADLILVEGAGSCCEVNLRKNDLANMGFAQAAKIPVLLIGDIDRGGVIASIVGSSVLLDEEDKLRIKGFLINKFRGDIALFRPALQIIEEKTKWKSYGVIPFIAAFQHLPQEDSLWLEHLREFQEEKPSSKKIKICIPLTESVSNFDDIDPLLREKEIEIYFVRRGQKIPENSDAILLLGSKSTIYDLNILYQEGWAYQIQNFAQKNISIIGICGGYQMLGRKIEDPDHLESSQEIMPALSLLNITTKLKPKKITRNVKAYHIGYDLPLEGYEIHNGVTSGLDCKNSLIMVEGRKEGAQSSNGLVWGTYLHGIFHNDHFRRKFLEDFGIQSSCHSFLNILNHSLDQSAKILEEQIDVSKILDIAQ